MSAALIHAAKKEALPPLDSDRSLTDLADMDVPQDDLVLECLSPGDVGMLAGGDGVGKSWVALDAALTVATGTSPGGIWTPPKEPGAVRYFAGEDRVCRHAQRTQALIRKGRILLAADDQRLRLYPLEGRRLPLMDKDGHPTAMGGRFAELVAGYRLVILDPLRMYHDAEESHGASMDALARFLVDVAITNSQVVLVVHHSSQSAVRDGRSDGHVGRGATDFPAACRGIWTLRRMADAEGEAFDVEPGNRKYWRTIINGKASHYEDGGQVWLRRDPDGLGWTRAEPGAGQIKTNPQAYARSSHPGHRRRRATQGCF